MLIVEGLGQPPFVWELSDCRFDAFSLLNSCVDILLTHLEPEFVTGLDGLFTF